MNKLDEIREREAASWGFGDNQALAIDRARQDVRYLLDQLTTIVSIPIASPDPVAERLRGEMTIGGVGSPERELERLGIKLEPMVLMAVIPVANPEPIGEVVSVVSPPPVTLHDSTPLPGVTKPKKKAH